MGKGKGNIKHFMARVQPGAILFEIYTSNERLARQAYKVASSKLPLQTKFISPISNHQSPITNLQSPITNHHLPF
jgi:ribosomal protein L16/L10AE